MTDHRIDQVLVSEAQIQSRLRELASEIVADSAGSPALYLVGVLTGAFIVMADLARELRKAGAPPVYCGFLRARTYGSSIKGSTLPKVEIEALPKDMAGKDVLIVEDILDQGITLAAVREHVLRHGQPRSLRVCALVVKDLNSMTPAIEAARLAAHPEYVGFHVPDRWIVGYGLDAAGEFRELADIVSVKEEYFREA